jgi:hypothetical protein
VLSGSEHPRDLRCWTRVVSVCCCVLTQAFGVKEKEFGKTLAEIVADVVALSATKSWLTEFCMELLVGVVHVVPFATYSHFLITPLLEAFKDEETKAPVAWRDASPHAVALGCVGGVCPA